MIYPAMRGFIVGYGIGVVVGAMLGAWLASSHLRNDVTAQRAPVFSADRSSVIVLPNGAALTGDKCWSDDGKTQWFWPPRSDGNCYEVDRR
jgi:hypothetical protein